MDWLYFSVIAGVGFGIQASLLKYASGFLPRTLSLTALFLGASILLFPVFIETYQIVSFKAFSIALFLSFLINIIAFQLLTTALELAPLTIVVPFLNLTPLFLFLNGWLILGEAVTPGNAFAILLVILGCLIIQRPLWADKNRSFNKPQKGILMAISVSFLWSISAAVEKIAVTNSSVFTYAFMIHILLGTYFGLNYAFTKRRALNLQVYTKRGFILFLALAGVTALMAFAQYTAITLTLVSSVITVKRAGVLVSTLIGFIYFKERNYLPIIVGTVIILTGIYILGSLN